MEFKNRFIKSVAIIGALVLVILTALPGCNFIGQTKDGQTTGVYAENGNQLCCPECSSTDINDKNDEGNYSCNECGKQWSYDEQNNVINVVDDNGNVVDTVDPAQGIASDGGSNGGSSYGGGSSNGGSSYGGSSNGGLSSNDSSSSNGNDSSSNSNSNSKYTTNATANKTAQSNISKIKAASEALGKSVDIVYNEETGDYTVSTGTGKDTGLFGYKYNDKEKIFYTAEDSWQRNFGFNETYDKAAAAGFMSYNTFRVYFTYDNLEWMYQFWKGQYGYAFIGSEIGVYTRPVGSSGTYYDCATDDQKPYMTMSVYRQDAKDTSKYNYLFTRNRCKTWWCTGFIPGTLGVAQINVSDKGTSKLMVDAKIEFKDQEMAQAFMDGLDKVTCLENNALVAGSKRSISFKQYSDESAYEAASSDTCKYTLCPDANGDYCAVRVCYR